jgi:Fe-Mn family superoxide dismutase
VRFGWEFNGMRLHEYYFENLEGDLAEQESCSGGSQMTLEALRLGKTSKPSGPCEASAGGPLQDPADGKLINFWINEHDAGHPAGGTPILDLGCLRTCFHDRLV